MNLDKIIKETLRQVLNEGDTPPFESNADAIWLNYTQILCRLAGFANRRYKKAHLMRRNIPINMSEVLELREMIANNLNMVQKDSGI